MKDNSYNASGYIFFISFRAVNTNSQLEIGKDIFEYELHDGIPCSDFLKRASQLINAENGKDIEINLLYGYKKNSNGNVAIIEGTVVKGLKVSDSEEKIEIALENQMLQNLDNLEDGTEERKKMEAVIGCFLDRYRYDCKESKAKMKQRVLRQFTMSIINK